MARISTYGITAPPLVGDKVIGTDVNGTPADATKNFTVESIAALAGTEELVTLQQVLNAGNTATESINLTGNITLTGSITAVNATITGTLSANGGTGLAGQILSSQGLGAAQWIDHDTLNPDLEEVLTVGNTATTEIILDGNATFNSTITAGGGGGVGTAGQVLSSQGAGLPPQWVDHDTLNPDLQEVLDVGNSALNTDLILSGSGELTAWGLSIGFGGSTFLSNVTFGSTITAGGGVGTAGQVLTSQGAGVSPQWLGVSITYPTITQVLNAGDNAGGHDITNLNSISTDDIVASGAVGVLGQLMQSTGGGITWVSSVNLTTVQTDNLIIDGGTITADGSTGTAGQVLASTVTGVEWVAAGGGGGGLTWVQKTASYTAVDGDMVGTRLVSTGYTISPPTSPALGMRFGVQDMSNLGNTYNITIDFNTQGTRWNSQASDLVLTKDSFCVIFEWVSVQVGWALVGGGIQ